MLEGTMLVVCWFGLVPALVGRVPLPDPKAPWRANDRFGGGRTGVLIRQGKWHSDSNSIQVCETFRAETSHLCPLLRETSAKAEGMTDTYTKGSTQL